MSLSLPADSDHQLPLALLEEDVLLSASSCACLKAAWKAWRLADSLRRGADGSRPSSKTTSGSVPGTSDHGT
eukprot:CAMPEP_0197695692 /NCGR_PEP_ID=MMETSP1338-20131121/115528_1 /TAXON_ID=43686 ORGANISM="Pelagodinium beii, Strain RCC1491" /NCGR_SAMPLE_ID=MMETSP1338 /ASSEMBLY_ACC=CAM_ASM_000754 /LENGTH=71 /DNA_ID=CAMNT_0043278705 /DNA_START=56 /DNA_END=271 /DNA_ORIENTATION=-